MYYEPNEIDLSWARMMVSIISEGGIMALPGVALIYTVSHKTRTIKLKNPERLKESMMAVGTHLMTKDVFGAIGYTVED